METLSQAGDPELTQANRKPYVTTTTLTKVLDDYAGCIYVVGGGVGSRWLPNLRPYTHACDCGRYPGGVVLSFMPGQRASDGAAADADADIALRWVRHGRVPGGEGVLTMAVDAKRRRAFFLTWPSGRFGMCRLRGADSDRSVGVGGGRAVGGVDGDGGRVDCPTIEGLRGYPGMHKGEMVHPRTGEYRCVCRSMVR